MDWSDICPARYTCTQDPPSSHTHKKPTLPLVCESACLPFLVGGAHGVVPGLPGSVLQPRALVVGIHGHLLQGQWGIQGPKVVAQSMLPQQGMCRLRASACQPPHHPEVAFRRWKDQKRNTPGRLSPWRARPRCAACASACSRRRQASRAHCAVGGVWAGVLSKGQVISGRVEGLDDFGGGERAGEQGTGHKALCKGGSMFAHVYGVCQ